MILACGCSCNRPNRSCASSADHAVLHYWDDTDWSDTLRMHSPDSVSPQVIGYVSVLATASGSAREQSLAVLLSAAASDTLTLAIMTAQLDYCLGDPNSPVRNEKIFEDYLQQLLRLKTLSGADRSRAEYNLKMIRKNQKGSIATNFTFTTREGRRMKLSEFEARRLVLVFYDPECPHCDETLELLYQNPRLQQSIAQGTTKVLAVYTEGNRQLWEKHKYDMPMEWTVAIDESGIVEKQLYDVPAMPMIYILDKDKRVLVKDAPVNEI